jgi:ATP-dependent Clp protease ATP-binding subunit ClpB
VTDTQGHTISFKNTVIIMTSNLGSSEIFDQLGSKSGAGEASGDGGGEGGGDAGMSHEERRLAVKEKVMEHVR